MDYVYIPHTRLSQGYISRFINSATLVVAALPERCRDIAISLFCTFYLIPCGNSTVFYLPPSVCSEQCFHLRNLCPVEWQQAKLFNAAREDLRANGLSFIDCNNTGLILEPLHHCCTDAGIPLRKCCCKTLCGWSWYTTVYMCMECPNRSHWWD